MYVRTHCKLESWRASARTSLHGSWLDNTIPAPEAHANKNTRVSVGRSVATGRKLVCRNLASESLGSGHGSVRPAGEHSLPTRHRTLHMSSNLWWFGRAHVIEPCARLTDWLTRIMAGSAHTSWMACPSSMSIAALSSQSTTILNDSGHATLSCRIRAIFFPNNFFPMRRFRDNKKIKKELAVVASVRERGVVSARYKAVFWAIFNACAGLCFRLAEGRLPRLLGA